MADADETARRDHVDRQRAQLPTDPGVYIYHDADGRVLYVGKAKNLRKRVASYFTKALDARRHALVMRIADIEVFVVSSEHEALVFEDRLIKRHKPPFNVMLRDDKSYPWVAVTLADEYPRVLFSRERRRTPGTKWFGPYSSAKRVRLALDLLNRVFPYRPCEGPNPGRQSGVPCLDFHMERCAAPCIGNISPDEYRVVIEDVMRVLGGDSRAVRARLSEQMQAASADLEFERAARLRNRLADLDRIDQLQAAERPGEGSFDVLAIASGDAAANVQLLQVRDGNLHDRRSHFLEQVEGVAAADVLVQFTLAHYANGRGLPAQLVVPDGMFDASHVDTLERELARIRGTAVEVRPARRGEKRRLAELALRNAGHALAYDSIRERTRVERRSLALEELRDRLGLESLPLRIECYDISNLQDEAPVASMVVLEDGRPRKDHYRKFAMRHTGGQDDFAMMHEVISRRFARLREADEAGRVREAAHEIVDASSSDAGSGTTGDPSTDAFVEPEGAGADPSFTSRPDLVIIDGGKGQLNAAVEALRALDVQRVPICSLAKQEELVFLPGRSDPVVLEPRSPSMHLVQRIRDEAHRFALGYHRARRGRHLTDERGSILDSLEGVGEARRRALLVFFGSTDRVLQASLEELEAVPGLPGKVARRIHEQLHRLAGGELAADVSRGAGRAPRDEDQMPL